LTKYRSSRLLKIAARDGIFGVVLEDLLLPALDQLLQITEKLLGSIHFENSLKNHSIGDMGAGLSGIKDFIFLDSTITIILADAAMFFCSP